MTITTTTATRDTRYQSGTNPFAPEAAVAHCTVVVVAVSDYKNIPRVLVLFSFPFFWVQQTERVICQVYLVERRFVLLFPLVFGVHPFWLTNWPAQAVVVVGNYTLSWKMLQNGYTD